MNWSAYFRLARFDKPVGIFLLAAPTLWALWIANHGMPSYRLVMIFLLGCIVMRAAGCIVNDIADRKLDCHVVRTALRPLTSGEISVSEAIGVLLFFLACAFGLLLLLPYACISYAMVSVLVTLLYPFCKRFMKAPQFVLGVAFSMGIPMAYIASQTVFDRSFFMLCCINFLWIVAYDTQYAMVDREDDQKIGVNSTAILFGDWDIAIISVLQMVMQLLWLLIAMQLHLNVGFFMAWLVADCILVQQYRLIATRDAKQCFQAFSLNVRYGLVMCFALGISGTY